MALSSKHRLSADINVVPYIDVMLVLLVIFMVTAPMLTQGVKVDLPSANSQAIETKEEPLIVSIKKDGSLYVNLGDKNSEKQAKPLSEISQAIAKVIKVKPNTPVLVWGDTAVPYGKVVSVMTALESAGIDQVGLVTEPN
jgi:biopolymer transport protein TolR